MIENKQESSLLSSLIRRHSPIMRAPPHDLIISEKPSFQIPSHWGLEFHYMNFWETQEIPDTLPLFCISNFGEFVYSVFSVLLPFIKHYQSPLKTCVDI